MSDLFHLWPDLAAWLGSHLVTPVLEFAHIAAVAGDPTQIAEAGMIALLQIGIISLIFRPLETWFPAEVWTDRKLTRIDTQYTLLMLLGLFPLFAFLVLNPIANFFGAGGADTSQETANFGLRYWVPWFGDHPYVLFAIYYVVYDLLYYWMHRAQHAIPWWWALHSMHHSQRQMSCWTNDRGNYLDGMLQSIILASAGVLMGLEPSEFAWLSLLSELVQNFSHANVRLGFGRVFERLFVDPTFHRLHHMRVDPSRPNLHNCNFGQVLSIWDNVFGTALYGEPIRPTGVGDPTVDADNERNLITLQWHSLRRFWGAVRRPIGWKFGEVAFTADYVPIPVKHADLQAFDHHETAPTMTRNAA